MLTRVARSHRQLAIAGALAAAAFWLATAAPASAAHRARLSGDLADQLKAGSQAIDVIVHGDRKTVDTLAARYNVKVRKYLKNGAVLRVTAGQLDALAQDEAVDHLSGDVRIQSSATPAASGIGADQVWGGTDGVAALTGAGVTVAVIDSGIDERHNALKKRVLHSEDFTGGDGSDRFGHGTHVAGIIAGQAGRTPDAREYQGIAAGASLVNLRVLDEAGAARRAA
jgi:subtilisin family serine protease